MAISISNLTNSSKCLLHQTRITSLLTHLPLISVFFFNESKEAEKDNLPHDSLVVIADYGRSEREHIAGTLNIIHETPAEDQQHSRTKQSGLTSPRCPRGGWPVFQSDLSDDSPLCCCCRCSWADTRLPEEHRPSTPSEPDLQTATDRFSTTETQNRDQLGLLQKKSMRKFHILYLLGEKYHLLV